MANSKSCQLVWKEDQLGSLRNKEIYFFYLIFLEKILNEEYQVFYSMMQRGDKIG